MAEISYLGSLKEGEIASTMGHFDGNHWRITIRRRQHEK